MDGWQNTPSGPPKPADRHIATVDDTGAEPLAGSGFESDEPEDGFDEKE